MIKTDVLIVGSGLSGLTLAYSLAEKGYKVLVCTKEAISESSSTYAQGGISVSLLPDDGIHLHIDDTLRVGGHQNNTKIVEHFTGAVRGCLQTMKDWGLPICLDNPDMLGKEGGHSHRRILRIGDSGLSGRDLMKAMWHICSRHDHISIAQGNVLTKVLTNSNGECIGGVFMDWNSNSYPILADYTVMASGGYSHIYAHATSPHIISGDAISLAGEAGARLDRLDLIQYHPTTHRLPNGKSLLLSEALRGEGAIIIDETGHRFLADSVPTTMELSPRNVLSYHIWRHIHQGHTAYLDLSPLGASLNERFRGIVELFSDNGVDITKAPIAITPACHYTIGGIYADIHAQTSISHLWAIGECAHTGLHGQDRLPSNSLMECIVSAFEASHSICHSDRIKDWSYESEDWYETTADEYRTPNLAIERLIDDARQHAWKYISIERHASNIQAMRHYLKEKKDAYTHNPKDYNSHQYMHLLNMLELVTNDIAARL